MTISASFAAAKRNRVSLPQSGTAKKAAGAAPAAERPVRTATFNSSL
ncbi:hypothetical protein AB0G74_01025 [Streptomyces sp. NPDC020875]